MRIVVVLAALALVAGCGGGDDEQSASPPALADLTVTVDPDGKGAKEAKTADVRCASADESDVCKAVAALEPKVFEPVAGMTACTEQFGGPETATVKGTLQGKPIDAKFSRVNGCEISRWNDAAPLLEAAG
jgi:FlaG/FlaF family flagellin (archaellin)